MKIEATLLLMLVAWKRCVSVDFKHNHINKKEYRPSLMKFQQEKINCGYCSVKQQLLEVHKLNITLTCSS